MPTTPPLPPGMPAPSPGPPPPGLAKTPPFEYGDGGKLLVRNGLAEQQETLPDSGAHIHLFPGSIQPKLTWTDPGGSLYQPNPVQVSKDLTHLEGPGTQVYAISPPASDGYPDFSLDFSIVARGNLNAAAEGSIPLPGNHVLIVDFKYVVKPIDGTGWYVYQVSTYHQDKAENAAAYVPGAIASIGNQPATRGTK